MGKGLRKKKGGLERKSHAEGLKPKWQKSHEMTREKNTYNTYKERERKRGGGAKEQADKGEIMTRTSMHAHGGPSS